MNPRVEFTKQHISNTHTHTHTYIYIYTYIHIYIYMYNLKTNEVKGTNNSKR